MTWFACEPSHHDHILLIVEADDRTSLTRGKMGLMIRVARTLNVT